MKLAILAPQRGHIDRLLPPLEMAYLAAVLEQQHIVRIYDLALCPGEAGLEVMSALRRFAPDLLVLPLDSHMVLPEREVLVQRAGTSAPLVLLYSPDLAEVAQTLLAQQLCDFIVAQGYEQTIVGLMRALGGSEPLPALPGAGGRNASLAQPWPLSPTADLDTLPFPARHLLQLEKYDLRAVDGQLQTTVLIGGYDPFRPDDIRLRDPSRVVLEMRSVAREQGIRHYLLPFIPVTHDLSWLAAFCAELSDVDPKIFWEGLAQPGQISETHIEQLHRSGCEAIWYQFDILHMLENREARQEFCAYVGATKARGIYTRTMLDLPPPYDRLPALINITATFGIEDVHFKVRAPQQEQPITSRPGAQASEIEQNAQRLYEETVSKQRMIDRFGAHLGPMLWRLGIGGAS